MLHLYTPCAGLRPGAADPMACGPTRHRALIGAQLSGLLVDCLVGLLADWLAGMLVDWWAGRLIGWLACGLAGWQVC